MLNWKLLNKYNFILKWNPNGIRALFTKVPVEIQKLFKTYDPDIVIWNEIKGNLSKHTEIEKVVTSVIPNYKWLWNHADKAGRHGVCISYKPTVKILNIDYGFGEGQKESEGRVITLELESLFVIGLYAVNAGVQDLKRLEYKKEWIRNLLNYMERLRKTGKHVVVMGDWNIAPTELDVHNHKKVNGCAGYTEDERHLFKIVQSKGWVDVFRTQYPDSKEFTYFGGTTKDGKRYGGWRIDHAVVNSELPLEHCKFKILKEYNGSDHVPIFFHISDTPIPEIIKPVTNAKLEIIKPAKLEIVSK